MMNFEIEDIKYKALNESVYCPPFKEENAIETIHMNTFDIEEVKKLIKESVTLLSYDKNYKPLIVEILDVLNKNKYEFLLDKQKYISFYWNGILILRIIFDNEVNHDKQLHISLQKYKTVKDEKIHDKKFNRLLTFGLAGSLVLGGIIVALTFFGKKD